MSKCLCAKQEFHSLLYQAIPFLPKKMVKQIFHSYYIGYRSQSYSTQIIPQLSQYTLSVYMHLS